MAEAPRTSPSRNPITKRMIFSGLSAALAGCDCSAADPCLAIVPNIWQPRLFLRLRPELRWRQMHDRQDFESSVIGRKTASAQIHRATRKPSRHENVIEMIEQYDRGVLRRHTYARY